MEKGDAGGFISRMDELLIASSFLLKNATSLDSKYEMTPEGMIKSVACLTTKMNAFLDYLYKYNFFGGA